MLIVDPADEAEENVAAFATAASEDFPDTAVMKLSDQATLIAGATVDSIALDRQLSAALTAS